MWSAEPSVVHGHLDRGMKHSLKFPPKTGDHCLSPMSMPGAVALRAAAEPPVP